MVPNWLFAKQFKADLNDPQKHFIEKELKIQQNASAFDFAPYLSAPSEGKQAQLQCIIGCNKGNLYTFDPYLMGEGQITKYYYNRPPCEKRKRIEIVKWFEPKNAEQNVNKFLVVYEDGTIYIFYVKNEDSTALKTVKFPDRETEKEVPQETIIHWMQSSVEDFDFDKYYTPSLVAERAKGTHLIKQE